MTNFQCKASHFVNVAIKSEKKNAVVPLTLGHNSLFTKAAEQAYKHRLAIDQIVEAVKPRLGHVRHYIPVRAKHVIREWPRDEIDVGDAD